MISATAEHAVRAVLFLARHDGARALSADAIAAELGAPRNYLAKTLNALAKAGIVHSARGAAGGFTLAIAPDQLTLARVISPFDDHARTPACLLKNRACDPLNPCAVHAQWTAIVGHASSRFEKTTVADLLRDTPIETSRPFARTPALVGDSPQPRTPAFVWQPVEGGAVRS